MKKLICLLLSVLPLMTSCKKEVALPCTVINDSLFQVVTVNPDDINKEEPGKISAFAEGVEYIPLHTEDSILIGEISRLIVCNDMYYIWDRLSESVFCFSQDGSYRYRLSKQGKGPDEYLNIADFTLNRKNGNIMIYSDRGQAFYEYTGDSKLVEKSKSPFIMSSFAVDGEWKYCYLGKLPNMDFYKDMYPSQYRYVASKDGEIYSRQLLYEYDDSFLRTSLSSDNFTFYGDTVLLTEFLRPEVFAIDSLGNLLPRYRIEFTTNTYASTFDEKVDLVRREQAIKDGELTTLFGAFYENSHYLFFNYARGLIGLAYVDKKDGSIHNPGYFLLDDFNQNTLSVSIAFVDEEYVYLLGEPGLLLEKKKRKTLSPYLDSICEKIQDFDNPMIIKIKLK